MTVHEFGNPRIADAGFVGDLSPGPATGSECGHGLVGDFRAHASTIAKLCYMHKQHIASKVLDTHGMKDKTINDVLAENLRTVMTAKKVVQLKLAKLSGIGQTTISLYLSPERRQPSKSGKIPSAKLTEIEALASALDVSVPKLLSPGLKLEQPVFVPTEAANDEEHAPVYLVDAKASAGKGEIVMSEDVTKTLMFRRDWLAKKGAKADNTIAFPVKGSSMVDAHIVNGSVVLADRGRTEPHPKKFYIVWIDNRLYVKELVRRDGLWWARSHNAAEADANPDILINDPNAHVVGKVFWCGFGL